MLKTGGIFLRNLIRNEKGSALAFVIMILLVLIIIIASVAAVTTANIKQASNQEKGMQAYYIARSGAEFAYEALLSTSLLSEFKGIDKTISEAGVDFGEGTADIMVSTLVPTVGSIDLQTIRIESVGTLKNENISRKVVLEFFYYFSSYPSITWSR